MTLANPLMLNNYCFHVAKTSHVKSRRRGQLSSVMVRAGAKKGGGNDWGEAVEDVDDGYLDGLSIEYESVWDTKPPWCQPWTILVTGASVSGVSWAVLRSIPVTAIVSSLIFAWWFIFLVSYPKAYSDMIAERRKSSSRPGINKSSNNL